MPPKPAPVKKTKEQIAAEKAAELQRLEDERIGAFGLQERVWGGASLL